MAGPERIMAEGISGPEPEGAAISGSPMGSARAEGQAPLPIAPVEQRPQRPWYVAPEYDPHRREEYTVTKEDNYHVFTDSRTGKEVARILEVAGGAETGLNLQEKPQWWPLSEKEWEDLDPKDRIVEGAVQTMRYFYDMPNAEREANAGKFNAAYKDFGEFALGKKLYSWSDKEEKDTRIIAAELELVNFDEKGIEKYDSAKQGQIRDALNRWDFLNREQVGIDNGRKAYGITEQTKEDDRLRPPTVSREEWEKYLERPTAIGKELEQAKKELTNLTGEGFFDKREQLSKEVRDKVKELKLKKDEEVKNKGIRADAEPWEKDAYEQEKKLEEQLLNEKEVVPVLDKSPNNKFISLSAPAIFNFIEEKSGESLSDQDKIDLEHAKNTLAWKFQEARNLGILDDLEERLEGRYQELAQALFSQSRAEQGDMDAEVRRGSRNLAFSEVREIIAKESDVDNPNSLTNTSELGTYWKMFSKYGVTKEDIQNLRGIRGVFVARAYEQMYDSLSRLYKQKILDLQLTEGKITQQKYDNFRTLETERISGDWDVLKCERELNGQLDAEERAQEDRLFYVDRYYLTLTGTTQAQVEQGVNNYLTSLLEGAHVYDVQTIMQKMQYLSAAIMSKKDVLMLSGMSASAAQDALTRINIMAENRGEFYVMNFVAQNIMMDEYYVPLFEKWGGVIGIEKLKKTLDMNNGLVAPTMLLFLDPKNRLLFQPAGFKGQGMKNTWAQRTLRNKIKGQLAKELVNYQANKEVNPTELMEQATWQDFLRKKTTDRFFEFQGTKLKPKEAVDKAESVYKQIADNIGKNPGSNKAEKEQNLGNLRKTREEFTKLRNKYDRALDEAKSAIDTTWQVFNIFGESARLGAPSIIMDGKECGDHISIEDATYFYKFAILDAMKRNRDTPARMRWRAYQWTKTPWQYDSKGNPVVIRKINGVDTTFNLVKGLEDTGITKEEYDAFIKAAKELRAKGYQAALKRDEKGNPVPGYSFEEIVSRNDVRPVQDNFISNYKSSREIFANSTAMREAKKGRQPFIMNILERLDQSGRGKFTTLDRAKIGGKSLEELPDEKLKELFEDAITDSLVFHITVRQLTLWNATFEPEMDSSGNMRCDARSNIAGKFSTDRIYYGSQDIPWGVKRLQYLPEYWMTNKRERVGRAWKLLPFIPLLKSDLAQECDAENLADLIMNVNKEHIDEPGLKQIAAGFKDAQGWRQRGETSVDEQRGETNWSFWDKPTVDSAQILKAHLSLPMDGSDHLKMEDFITAKNPQEYMNKHPLSNPLKKQLVDIAREILKREAPLNAFLEAQLGYNRSAGGSGIGLELGERWHYRVLNWWLSPEEGERQEQGGLLVNSDAETFFKLITIKNSWSDGMSILDEAWRQARGTKDAGASDHLPQPVIT